MGRGRRVAVAVTVAVAGVVGIPVVLAWSGPPGGVGDSPSAPTATAPTTTPTTTAPTTTAAVAVRPTARPPARPIATGVRGVLRIPGLGIEAPVDSVGLDSNVMAIPDDVDRLGWLDTTAAARDLSGASVISGHVSDSHDRPGALWDLHEVTVGDRIAWTDTAGRTTTFTVSALETHPRKEGLPSELFRTDGAHVLHLITCTDRRATPGGGFHYAANLVVTARVSAGRP
jgi:Sortase domain